MNNGKYRKDHGIIKKVRQMDAFKGDSGRVAIRRQMEFILRVTSKCTHSDGAIDRAEVFRLCFGGCTTKSLRFVRLIEATLAELGCGDDGLAYYMVIPQISSGRGRNAFCIALCGMDKTERNALSLVAVNGQKRHGHTKAGVLIKVQHTWALIKEGKVRLEAGDVEEYCRNMQFTIETVRSLQDFFRQLKCDIRIFACARTIRGRNCNKLNTRLQQELCEIGRGGSVESIEVHSRIGDTRTPLSVPDFYRIVVPLRWSDGADVLQMFESMIHHAYQRAQTMGIPTDRVHTHLHSFYHFAKMLCPSGGLFQRLDSITRDELLCVIRGSGDSVLYRASFSRLLSKFTRNGPWKTWLKWSDWPSFTESELGIQTSKRQRVRGIFTREEIGKLFEHFEVTEDYRSAAWLRFFIHTGARKRAVSMIKVAHAIDENGSVRMWVDLLEKFGKVRRVRIDPLLAEAIRLYWTQAKLPMSAYLFHHDANRMQRNPYDRWLRVACKKCQIVGDHVHVHALRRTVITWLYEAGNKVDTIRRWVGHEDTKTTERYIEQTPEQLYNAIVMPWINTSVSACKPTLDQITTVVGHNVKAEGVSSVSSSSGYSEDEQEQEIQLQVTRKICELYTEMHEEYNHLVSEVLTDVQRHTFSKWQSQKSMKKTQQLLADQHGRDLSETELQSPN